MITYRSITQQYLVFQSHLQQRAHNVWHNRRFITYLEVHSERCASGMMSLQHQNLLPSYLTLTPAQWTFKSHPWLAATPFQERIYDQCFNWYIWNSGPMVKTSNFHREQSFISQYWRSCNSNIVLEMFAQIWDGGRGVPGGIDRKQRRGGWRGGNTCTNPAHSTWKHATRHPAEKTRNSVVWFHTKTIRFKCTYTDDSRRTGLSVL